jgi:hypothetical protein
MTLETNIKMKLVRLLEQFLDKQITPKIFIEEYIILWKDIRDNHDKFNPSIEEAEAIDTLHSDCDAFENPGLVLYGESLDESQLQERVKIALQKLNAESLNED